MLTVMKGRSRRLWPRVLEEIGRAHAEGAQRLFLITPDQYTLQAELELVERLNLPGLLTIEVLSPSRLMTRVFTLAGSPQRVRIDARGKAMVLTDVLRESEADLGYYGGAARRQGFADRLAGSIGDFKRSRMTPEEVREMADKLAPDDPLRGKIHDMALLFERYEARLAGAFIDGEDAQDALIERLPQSGLLDGARIWLYGFDMMTPQFLRQLAVLSRGAEEVRLALTWADETAGDAHVFAPMREILRQIGLRFHEEALLWDQEVVDAPLEAAQEIQHLERALFAIPPVQYDQPIEAISLSVAANPYDEAMRTAERMLTLARAGMPFERMFVVLGSAEGYAGAIESAFRRSGIPYHLTRKRPAIAHPLIRAWLAALRCVTSRWPMDDALDWLKGGFSGLTIDEAERLENYAIEHGLRDRKWKRVIDDPELDEIRVRFVQPLEAMQARIGKARDTTAQLTAVYQLLEDTGAYDTLEAWQRTLQARGMLAEAAECAQAWRLALETLDQLSALLRGSRIRMRDLAQVVAAGFAEAELHAVPASPGCAQVGELGNMKISGGCRVLFLLGMQDGILRSEVATLMTDAEVARVASALGKDRVFAPSGDTLSALMHINLLDTISAPTERLYISHASTGRGGEAQRPATMLTQLRRAFPDLPEEGSAVAGGCVVHAPGAALDALGPMLREAAAKGEMTERQRETAAWLLHEPRTRLAARGVLNALVTPLPAERLGKRAADTLYAHTRTSITRLESFANCPFKHYVTYGLRPMPRRAFEVARNEIGTFYHRAMEGYTKEAARAPEWPDVDRAESDAMMDTVLEPLRAEWESAPLGDNAMLRAAGDAFCRVARRAAWTYAGQMKRGGFRTGVIEARFGPGEMLPAIGLMLPDGGKCWVEGRIDRIDFYEEEGERWLRVVDYKSGGTTLEPTRLYGGLQLQLLLYLAAALAAYPGVAAAGAFYSRLDDPLAETDSRDVRQIERILAKDLRLQGMALSDVRVIRAMEDGADLLKADGTPRKRSDIATEDELALLMRHAYTLASGMAEQIASGEIIARPAQLEDWKACNWCDYKDICGFDPSQESHGTRRLPKLTKDALIERFETEG